MSSFGSFRSAKVVIGGLLAMLAVVAVPSIANASSPSSLLSSTSAQRVEVRPAGQIVVLGTTGDADVPTISRRLFLLQLTANGQVDTSFASGGLLLLPEEIGAEPQEFFLQANGDTVVGTRTSIARVKSNGTMDPGFGTQGVVTVDLKIGAETFQTGPVQSLTPDPAGGYLLQASIEDPPGATQNVIARYTDSGSLDQAFAGDGRAEVDLPSQVMITSASGDIYSGTPLQVPWPGHSAAFIPVVVKYDSSGSPVTTYGPNGNGVAPLTPPTDQIGIEAKFDVSLLVVDNTGAVKASGSVTDCVRCAGQVLAFDAQLDSSGTPVPDEFGYTFSYPDGVTVDYTAAGDRLAVGPYQTKGFGIQGMVVVGDLPDIEYINHWRDTFVGPWRSYATDSEYGPGNVAATVGTAFTDPGCSGPGCRSSLVVTKIDDGFGIDDRATIFPAIECPYFVTDRSDSNNLYIKFCRHRLDAFQPKARLVKARSKKPGAVLTAKLPAPMPDDFDSGPEVFGPSQIWPDVTILLPKGLKLRSKSTKRIKATITGGGQSQLTSFGRAKFRAAFNSLGSETSTRSVKITIKRGALKPLRKGQLKRRLKFGFSIRYQSGGLPDQFRNTSALAPKVKRSR